MQLFSFIIILRVVIAAAQHHIVVELLLSLRVDDVTDELCVNVRSLQVIILLHILYHHPDVVLPSVGDVDSRPLHCTNDADPSALGPANNILRLITAADPLR